MNQSSTLNALNKYRNVGVASSVDAATPHQLIKMLLDGALARIAAAKGYLARKEIGPRGESISMAISIIGGLKSALNLEQGGEVARNLDDLYDYLGRRLFHANRNGDMDALNEAQSLLHEIKAGWDAIPEDFVNGKVTPLAAKQ